MKGYDFGVGCNNWVEGTSGIRSQLSSLIIWAPIRNWWSLNFTKSDSEVVNPCRTPAKSPNIRRQNQILSLIVQVGNYDCTKFSTNWRSKNVKPVWGPMSQGQHGTPRYPGGDAMWNQPGNESPMKLQPNLLRPTGRRCQVKVPDWRSCLFYHYFFPYECINAIKQKRKEDWSPAWSKMFQGKQRSESTP